jgi:hypothetical protein
MIACIWEYFGTDSNGKGKHFEKHLIEFIAIKRIQNIHTGTIANTNMHSFVWCAGSEEDLLIIINTLKSKHILPQKSFKEFGIYI